MKEQRTEVTELSRGTVDVAANAALNLQAVLQFELVGTNLFAMYQKDDTGNTFLIMPNDDGKGDGMTIDQMISEINALISGVSSGDTGLDSDKVKKSVSDVVDASAKKSNDQNALEAINWGDIKVYLNQAFFYLNTGKPAEYALSISIDTSALFPAGQSIFNVFGLTVGIWNTDKKKVLERMKLVKVDDCLKSLE